MRIAIFTDTYLPQMNGVVSYLSNAIEMLSKKHDVILFAPGRKKFRVQKKNRLKIYWIPSSPFPFYEGYKIASMNYKRVSDLLRKESPDVVHVHAPVVLGIQGIIAAKRKNIPVVITHHTHFPEYVPHLLNGKLPKPLDELSGYTVKKLIKHVYAGADVVTAPTQELAKELNSYGLRNVLYLPNGIKLKKFKKNPKAAARFKKQFKIPPNKKIILYLGRVSFEKRLDVLLHAFSIIENDDRLLLVAGDGPYLGNLKKLAKALGIKNIKFTGFLRNEQIHGAYACADIFASPSDTETFGLTFVEAMHTGLPVIGVRMLGAKELIKNGKTGLLVKPGSARAFARAMEGLLKKRRLCARLGKNAHKQAKAYSLNNSIIESERIYKKVIGYTP